MTPDPRSADERLLDLPARVVAGLALALVLAGAVIIGAAGDERLRIAGGGVLAIGATIIVALGFYAVGRSEDRDRARRGGRPTGVPPTA